MTDVQLHEPGACPGGCEEIQTVEQRLDDAAIRMAKIEASLTQFGEKLDAHTRMSAETNSTVSEVLEILHAGKGFFKVLGYIATAIKWTAAFAAPVIALIYTIKTGGKP